MKRFNLLRGSRNKGASGSQAQGRRPRRYRPRLEALEERLPPGDSVLGALLAWTWAQPASLTSIDSCGLAPEGRQSVARGVSPWEAVEESFGEPPWGDRAVARSEFLSPFQGSEGQGLSDSQGWRPGLPTVAPPGLADELTDGTVSNPVRPQRSAMPLSAADVHASYRPADGGNGFTGLSPMQPFWVTPALPAAEGTPKETRSAGPLVQSVADTESAPAGPGGGVHAPGISAPSTITLDSQLASRQGPDGKCSHTPEQYQTIVTNMRERLEGAAVPGGGIAIVCNGQLDFAAGVGVKDYQEKDPVTPDTLFRAASLTKMLTGITALSLVDEGKLDLHRPITDYLPWFEVRPPFQASSITTHDLLTHRAGLPAPAWVRGPTGPGALEDYFREASPMTLWAPPGRYFNYSNVGFCLAGLVAETIDGRPYDDVVQARVLDRAGMKTATFDPEVAEAGDFATGHDMTPEGRVTQTYRPTSYDAGMAHPAGGAFASVRDYAHLAEVLLDDGRGMLTPKSNRALQSPQAWAGWLTPETYYGYGLAPDKYKGMDIVWHRGAASGFLTYFVMVPETKDAVVIFTNASGSSLGRIDTLGQSALDTLYGLEQVPLTDYRTPPATWTAYEGTYYDPTRWGEIRVELRDDRLWFHFVDVDWSGSTTQNLNGDFTINPGGTGAVSSWFHRRDEGPAEALILNQNATALRVS